MKLRLFMYSVLVNSEIFRLLLKGKLEHVILHSERRDLLQQESTCLGLVLTNVVMTLARFAESKMVGSLHFYGLLIFHCSICFGGVSFHQL